MAAHRRRRVVRGRDEEEALERVRAAEVQKEEPLEVQRAHRQRLRVGHVRERDGEQERGAADGEVVQPALRRERVHVQRARRRDRQQRVEERRARPYDGRDGNPVPRECLQRRGDLVKVRGIVCTWETIDSM
jgi:hypothetical protein